MIPVTLYGYLSFTATPAQVHLNLCSLMVVNNTHYYGETLSHIKSFGTKITSFFHRVISKSFLKCAMRLQSVRTWRLNSSNFSVALRMCNHIYTIKTNSSHQNPLWTKIPTKCMGYQDAQTACLCGKLMHKPASHLSAYRSLLRTIEERTLRSASTKECIHLKMQLTLLLLSINKIWVNVR